MSETPWGPHGPRVPANTTTPNPTAADTPMNIGGGGDQGTFVTGGGGGGGLFAKIVVGLVMVALLWIPMLCLYPLTGLAALTTGFVLFSVLAHVFPPDFRESAVVLGFGAGAVVAFFVYRFELRLAEQPAFRRMRHVVRMALLALWAIPIIQLSTGATAPTTSTRYILAVMTSPGAMISYLMNPIHLVIWVAVVIGLHYLIWSSERVRQFWHRLLVYVGLK
ncbi:MAG TPA: hypothetical protein VFV19_10295 [Candidatus Polarisedimenticolaceae bacterium]|nr:hypothetical protein [Candidatus Polarisedimenticolaceae bacterium]